MADGAADSDVATVAQLRAVATAAGTGIHFYGVKDSSITAAADGNNYNGSGASGEKTVAIGPNVVVSGARSNSVGYGNTVSGTLSDVYGNGNVIAEGTNNAVVLGNSNKVGSNSVAIGTWDKAKATNSVFIGGNDVSESKTTDKKGWSVGTVNADGTYTEIDGGGIVTVTADEVDNGGAFAKKNNMTDETSWDDDTSTASAKAASFGVGIDIGGTGTSTGTTSDTTTTATTDETIDKVTVVGKAADASGTGSVSVGYGAKSDNGNVALGYNSQATTALDSNKKGYLTDTDAPSSYVSVGDGMDGSAAKTRRITNVADGSDAQDAVTVAQLTKVKSDADKSLTGKANVDASNVGANLQYKADGTPAAEDSDKTVNENAWGTAIGTGKIANPTKTDQNDPAANGSQQLVTGGTVYTYNAPVAETGKTLNYVSADKTTGQNLTALDTQVKANADILNDSTHNIKYYSVNSTNAPTLGLNAYTNEKNDGATGRASLAAGFITHADGLASTVAGSYSGVYNEGTVSGTDFRGAAALSYGTVNINKNTDATKTFSGAANSLIGQGNMTTDSNAAIILGAGNTVKDSYRDISNFNMSGDMEDALKKAVPNSGGQVMVMGGGNSVEKAYMTQVTGVGNTVTGSGTGYGTDSTQLNYIEGFYTTLKNGKNDYLIGAHNTVTGDSTDKNQSNIVFGDNHTLTNTRNNIIVGSADNGDTTTVSDVVSIGHNAKVTKEGGVAIGSESEATTAAGVAGYDPTGAAETGATWKATNGAVSIGKADGSVTRQINGVAAGTNETDAVNVAQLKKLDSKKADADAGNLTDSNVSAWQKKLGNGSVAANNKGLVTGGTVYSEVRPAQDGSYVKTAKTTGENLTALDTQVGKNTTNISTNTTDISNLKNLSNITDDGRTVIKNLAKDTVKVAQGARVTVTSSTDQTTGAITYTVSANDDGKVAAGDKNLVSGDTVNTAIQNASDSTDTKLKNKANINADNIGANLKAANGTDAATAEEIKTNKEAWASAIGTGTIASDSNQLVTGTTVYSEVRPTQDGSYVKTAKTTGENLTALDTQVGKNTTNISTNTTDISNLKNLSNITDDGRTVIKNLAKDTVKVAQGARVTVTSSTDQTTGAITYTVSANNDGKVAAGDKNLVSGDTVNTAITKAIKNAADSTDAKLAGKANVDASNIGANLTKNADGTDATDADKKANAEAWGSAIGTGEIKADDGRMVTGKTVYNELRPTKDGSYVKKNQTTAENLTALDTKIGKLDSNGNYIKADDSVSQNLSTLDTRVKNNADAITTINNSIGDLSDSAVKYDADTKKTRITLAGDGGTTITNVKDGAVSESSTDAVNGKQLWQEQQDRKDMKDLSENGKTVIRDLAKGSVKVINGTNTTVTVGKEGDATTYAVDVAGSGKVASGDTGLISGGTLYNEVHVEKDGSYIKGSNTVGQNLSSLDTGLKTTSDLIHTSSGGDTIHIGENSSASKVDVSGKDSGGSKTGRVVTGVVTDMNDANSAANVGYVNGVTAANTQQIYHDMNSAYSRLDSNINKAAAGANALAALHPLDYDPDDKLNFAAGFGHYHSANAAAVGAFYYPNERTLINVGFSMGNGDPGINAGISFRLGKGSVYNGVSKAAMAQTIHDQAVQISDIKAADLEKDKRIDALEKENQEMKQQIQEILKRLNG